MKTEYRSCLLATVTLTALMALGQSGNLTDENNPRQLVARCAYTQSEPACEKLSRSDQRNGDGQIAQAQFPRCGPQSGPRCGPRRYPGPYGPPPYMYGSYDDGHHAVIGALIGFGAGFALGAGANQNSGSRVGSGLIVGALGAVFGAAIGHGIATFPHHSFRRHRWSDEDDDDLASSKLPRHYKAEVTSFVKPKS